MRDVIMNDNVLLDVHELVKQFGDFIAVKGTSFFVKEGEIVGLLGANGAGKTTTMHMLMGAMTPTSGSINYFGKDFNTHRSEILQKVTFASTYIKLPSRLSVMENLLLYAQLYGLSYKIRMERIEYFLKFFDMWHIRDRAVGVLSAGQLTRVMLSKAFIPEPRLVLLDEPTAALDPDIAIQIREFIKEQQKERNLAVLLTSHNMGEVSSLCDRVLVMKHGNIIANSTPKQLTVQIRIVRVEFLLTSNAQQAQAYVQGRGYNYTWSDPLLTVEVDEQEIASLLQAYAQQNILYSQISIDKPTLEDYFLTLSQQSRTQP